MNKLIIPAAAIPGRPLTTEELKSVIGGAIMAGNCTCSYKRTGPEFNGAVAQHQFTVETATSAECKDACIKECNNDSVYKCKEYKWEYLENVSGTGPR